ncbi:MAG: TIGR03545 family protein [bacterium]
MKLIRWKAVIPILVLTIIFVVFGIFLRDRILKGIVISTGESIFEAKVEMESFKTSLKDSSIEIKGLQIADKSDVWKNLVHIDRLAFDIRLLPLFSKKVAIDEMALENLRWQTKRATSGKLPPKKEKKINKKKEKEKKDSFASKLFESVKKKAASEIEALPVTQNLQNIEDNIKSFDAKKLVSSENLQSRQRIEDLTKGSEDKYNKYKGEINSLNVEKQAADTKVLIDDLKGLKVETIADIPKVQDAISRISTQKKSIDATVSRVTDLQKEISTQFADTKQLALEVDDLIKADYNNLLSKVKIPGVGEEGGIAKALFGKMWYDRVDKVLHYIQLARKYMPPRKEKEEKTMYPRAKGVDVVFHKKEKLPGFSIQKISLSGTTGGEGKDVKDPVTVAGLLSHLSSDQKVYGKPTGLDMKGDTAGRIYKIDGLFDHTSDIPLDMIGLGIKNFPIGELNLPQNDLLPKFKRGGYDVDSKFTVRGDELDCMLLLTIKDIIFEIEETSNELKKVINEIFESISTIELRARLYGTDGNLKTEIDSNLDNIISDKIKSIYGRKIKELEAKVKAELNARINQEKEKLMVEYNKRKEELMAIVKEKLGIVDEQKKALTAKADEYKKEIDNRKSAEQEKAKEEIKKGVEGELKKLFGN